MSAATKGCLIQGVGYIVPDRNVLYEKGTGNRIRRLNDNTKLAISASAHGEARRKAIYYDPAVMCDETELMAFGLVGKPLCVMHDTSQKIGSIVNASVCNNELLITASVTDRAWSRRISEGNFDLKSFSVSYDIKLDDRGESVASKHFTEISMVDEPYYPGCHLEIYASKTEKEETAVDPGVISVYGDAIRISAFHDASQQEGDTDVVTTDIDMESNNATEQVHQNATVMSDAMMGGQLQQQQQQQQQTVQDMDMEIQQDEDATMESASSLSGFGESGANTVKQGLVSEHEALRREYEALKAKFEEVQPIAEKHKEESRKKADEISKHLIGLGGGLTDESKAKAEALANMMREISETKPEVLAFFADLQSATKPYQHPTPEVTGASSSSSSSDTSKSKQQQKSGSWPNSATTAPKTQYPPTQQKPTQQSQKPAFPKQQPQQTIQKPQTQNVHRPVADFSSGRTENVPIHKANSNKRQGSVLSEIYGTDVAGATKKTRVNEDFFGGRANNELSVAAGMHTNAINDRDATVLLSPAMADLWGSSIVHPIMNKTASPSENPFFRKPQSTMFGGTGQQQPTLTVAASRCAKGEIPDCEGGRGILPYTANYNVAVPISHNAAVERQKTLSTIFPDNVAGESQVKAVGAVLNWNASLHVFDHDDEPMCRVMNSDMSRDFEVVNQTNRFTIAASKQPAKLDIKNSQMEREIAVAKTCAYFAHYSDAQLATLACLAGTELGAFWDEKTIPSM